MENKNPWPIKIGDEQFTEREARDSVEKNKAMFTALESIEKFVDTGELPVINGEAKKTEDIIIGLDNWDKYCEKEFEGDKKTEMQAKLKNLREKVESKIAKNS